MFQSLKVASGPLPTKILVQYRVKRGMAYEIKGADGVLVVEITTESEEEPCQWRVQARGAPNGAVPMANGPIDGWGATRAQAVSDAARAWAAATTGLRFDWEAVERELRQVRAI